MKQFQKGKGFIIGVLIATLVFGVALPALGVNLDVLLNFANIKLNGEVVAKEGENFTLYNGDEVPYSIIYKGTTYVPLANFGRIMGKDVGWDNDTKTVLISDKQITAPSSILFGAGQYVVGEDIAAGTYDCKAVSGSGNFIGDVKSLGFMGLNEILGAPGTYWEDTPAYNGLRLGNGDTFTIHGDLQIEFVKR
ncbi:MAG: copper amine oxidase N-terminal domain-containing protein [Oscillospiraceae bacterium]|nr:copper amine oxidase N-terminal domain-containing protein [Oscillospiraceae bacterium]